MIIAIQNITTFKDLKELISKIVFSMVLPKGVS
jgi:hypothetical protein